MSTATPSPADPAMKAYYAARAREYERIYAKPERQADLRRLEQLIPAELSARNILEVACGTGYWTRHLARVAKRILATDLTPETLDVARSKDLPTTVRFAIADAFDLPAHEGPFDGAYAGFWWSHLRRRDRNRFFGSLKRCLAPGARVVLMDNRYVEGSSTPIARCDAEGDTWQRRSLEDGSTHEVLKNFPTERELQECIHGYGTGGRYVELEYYWLFSFDSA